MPAKTPPRRCPRCVRRILERSAHEGRTVDLCPRCGGLWCEPSNWDRETLGPPPGAGPGLQPARDPAAPARAALLGPDADTKHPDVAVTPRQDLNCPACRTPLTSLQVGGPEGCEVNQCVRCGGVWLDSGEWEQLESLRTWQRTRPTLEGETTWGEWALQFFTGLPTEFNVPPRHFPVVTAGLIAACVLVYGLQVLVGPEAWLAFALRPRHIAEGRDLYTLVTDLFLHAGPLHLFFNMYFLYVLGDNVEDALGRLPYLLFYFGCGLLANMAQVLGNLGSDVPVVGASGAIAGVMAAYVVLYPQARLTFMLIFWQFKLAVWWWMLIWLGGQVLGAWIDLQGAKADVAFLAHLGGFVTGLAIIVSLRRRIIEGNPLLRVMHGFPYRVEKKSDG
jgi:membrane associated rhomboid family serine protease